LLTVIGDGQDVRTRAELDFPQPLNLELDAWNIPTNLVHDPLIGFTAIRGIRSLLKDFKPWNDLQVGAPPNQLYFWGMAGMPILEFAAAPMKDASNTVHKAAERIPQAVNPWLAGKRMGNLTHANTFDGLDWKSAPFMEPQLRSEVNNSGGFAFVTLIPPGGTNRPPPSELLQSVYGRTNLVFYDWELTALRLEQVLYLGQLLRLVAQTAQMPPLSASLDLLKSSGPALGNCVTVVTAEGANHLSLIRRSICGFSSVELHLLADWLESPRFPNGLHTLLGRPPLRPDLPPATTAPLSPARK
jgi:hypothetical protein